MAVVVDAGGNRLAGIAATFRVVKGSGRFANGQQALSFPTDSDGRLIVSFVTDPTEGVAANVVEATIDALPGGPRASFVASTWAAGDPSSTVLSGVVLDNSNLPIAGVTLRVRDTTLTATTDAQGLFRIAPAPVGTVKLIVDGSTALRPGAWPDLEFDITTVPGRDNGLRMPIYLLPRDLADGVLVDETHGARLTLPQLPGFALEIQPGSVIFPGGSRSGAVSVTVVHSDKVPMVPNFGQQPRLIVTIQPAGARFDPPARLTLPNVEGFAPGQVTEFYSFDHDLGHFVSIGPGTVSDDATVITSNPGVGIAKAGWHCSGFPQGSGTPNSCPECTKCVGDLCKPEDLCHACGKAGMACDGDGPPCKTGKELIPKICDKIGIQEEGQAEITCDQVPDLRGQTGLCGAAIAVTYRRVTIQPNCQAVDLVGGNLIERITSDFGCGGSGDIVLGGCPIKEGNMLAESGSRCRDYYWVCKKAEFLPEGFSCRETLTQEILIDSCLVATKKIVFTSTGQR